VGLQVDAEQLRTGHVGTLQPHPVLDKLKFLTSALTRAVRLRFDAADKRNRPKNMGYHDEWPTTFRLAKQLKKLNKTYGVGVTRKHNENSNQE